MNKADQPIIIIPARMQSTRLPNKPLAPIGGKPMIVQCWLRAQAAGLGPVWVAASDQVIVDAVMAAGGNAVLTDPDLPSGTDRIAAALSQIDPDNQHQIILNMQGDLPLLPSHILTQLYDILRAFPDAAMSSLAGLIHTKAELENENIVKVIAGFKADRAAEQVAEQAPLALAFSRAPVPWGVGPHYHHVGLYGYRRAALDHFISLPPSPLEKRERLEQMRALEAGMTIRMGLVADDDIRLAFGVDTAEDLKRAQDLLAG